MNKIPVSTMDEYHYCLTRNCWDCKNKSKCAKDLYIFKYKAERVGAKAIKDEIKKEKELAKYKKAFELFVEDTLDLGATNYSKTAIKCAVKSAIKEYLDKVTELGRNNHGSKYSLWQERQYVYGLFYF